MNGPKPLYTVKFFFEGERGAAHVFPGATFVNWGGASFEIDAAKPKLYEAIIKARTKMLQKNPVRDPQHKKLLKELSHHFETDEKFLRKRGLNPNNFNDEPRYRVMIRRRPYDVNGEWVTATIHDSIDDAKTTAKAWAAKGHQAKVVLKE